MAPTLQLVFTRSDRLRLKPHVVAVLQAFGFGSEKEINKTLRPPVNYAARAFEFFDSFGDREWITYAPLTQAFGTKGGSLKDIVMYGIDSALSAIIPDGTVVAAMSEGEKALCLGGYPEFKLETRRAGKGAVRAWWRQATVRPAAWWRRRPLRKSST